MSEAAKAVPKKQVEEIIGRDFGLYSGKERHWAKLLFTAKQAPWVKSETWHSDQIAETNADGSYLLAVPYSDSRELILEILRYGADVRVLAPPELQQAVAQRLRVAADQYSE